MRGVAVWANYFYDVDNDSLLTVYARRANVLLINFATAGTLRRRCQKVRPLYYCVHYDSLLRHYRPI